LGGWGFNAGDDPGHSCGYWGADLGLNFGPIPGAAGAGGSGAGCGCGRFGVDLFYRNSFLHFDRTGGNILEDGGTFQSVGIKATYERAIGSSRFHWYVGVGPEYVWTTDYLHDDTGFGGFAEVGLGYRLSSHLVVRGGVDIHADW